MRSSAKKPTLINEILCTGKALFFPRRVLHFFIYIRYTFFLTKTSSRLSTRPMAWSKATLKKLAPVLAAGKATFESRETAQELPAPLRNAAASASKAFRKGALGLPDPDSIGRLPTSGKVTGTQILFKRFA